MVRASVFLSFASVISFIRPILHITVPYSIIYFEAFESDYLPSKSPKVSVSVVSLFTKLHWITNGKLLPTNCTKSVFLEYEKASKTLKLEPGHIVGERLFYDLWQRLLPFVRTMPPASDLYSTCEQGTIALRRSANKSDEQKSNVVHVNSKSIRPL